MTGLPAHCARCARRVFLTAGPKDVRGRRAGLGWYEADGTRHDPCTRRRRKDAA